MLNIELIFTTLVPVMLFIMMMGMGLSLTLADLWRIVKYPKAALIGLVGQLLFLPLLAFGLANLLAVPPAIAAGGMLLAACPGGVTSNGYVFVSRGDVSLSVTLTAITSLLTIVTIPLIAWLAMQYYYGDSEYLDLPVLNIVGRLVLITALPVSLGMVIRHYAPIFADVAVEKVRQLSLALLIVIIVGATLGSWHTVRDHFLEAGLLAVCLNVIAMVSGWSVARFARLPAPQVISITYEIGVQNLSLAVMVAISILQKPELAILAVVYALIMKITALSFMAYARRTQAAC